MSIGEFVLALVGVVLGLGVGDLLFSFHKLLRAGRRVKWDWLTPVLAIQNLLAVVVFWWWSFHWYASIDTLTIAEFAPKFAFLIISFLMVSAALPDDVPAEGIDLREFYFASAPHLWSLTAIALALPAVIQALARWREVGIAFEFSLGTISFILALCAIRSKRVWLHALALGWIISVTCYFNWNSAIG